MAQSKLRACVIRLSQNYLPSQLSISGMRIAFLHPDLGIGGAERLIVDAALGLQQCGHIVHIYTSHHDPSHCFEETRDGTLKVYHIHPPPYLPRSLLGKGHILLAHFRQLHLTYHLLTRAPSYDIFFVDQLSTCIPLLRSITGKRVVFYGHFPDKLLADGQFVEGVTGKRKIMSLKGIYRMPMDWIEEFTTRQADILLVNSRFTARIFKEYFPTVTAAHEPRVVYPGINISAYMNVAPPDPKSSEVLTIASTRPTLISLNRFEKKKNAALAIQSFAMVRERLTEEDRTNGYDGLRLVLAGGFDPRLADNIATLTHLTSLCKTHSLSYAVIPPTEPFSTPSSPPEPDVTFLLNFTSSQRTVLLTSKSTLALLYTPSNEHFGIGPVEAMISKLPVVACDSGGPVESVVDPDYVLPSLPPEDVDDIQKERTGYLRPPTAFAWTSAILSILRLSPSSRIALGANAQARVLEMFSLEAMTGRMEEALEDALKMGDVQGRHRWWWVALIWVLVWVGMAGIIGIVGVWYASM